MRSCALVVLIGAVLLAGRPIQAQSYSAFDFKAPPALTVPAFTDIEIKQLIATLDRLLASATNEDAATVVWQFARRLQAGKLTSAQETRVVAHLDTLSK